MISISFCLSEPQRPFLELIPIDSIMPNIELCGAVFLRPHQ